MFSGTPCQIDGLKNYLQVLRIDTENLITVDILCHGVPSPLVWKDFLAWKAEGRKIESVDFWDKGRFGWRDHRETISYESGAESSREYTDLFFSHLILCPSCFHCAYKTLDRCGDITIGDYWRIENLDKEYDDDKGISLVSLNTIKGQQVWERIQPALMIREYPKAVSIQPALDHSYPCPVGREAFWEDYRTMSFQEAVDRGQQAVYGKPAPIHRRILSRGKRILVGLVRKVLYGKAGSAI